MIGFLWAILLALIWAAANREFSPLNLGVGFVLGYLLLRFTRPDVWGEWSGPRLLRLVTRLPRLLRFIVFYVWELILSNLRVAYDVITPGHFMKPAVIGIPLDARTDLEITLLGNLLTLTPGSLCLDVSDDRKTMYVHVMYLDEGGDVGRKIKEQLERRVLEVLR